MIASHPIVSVERVPATVSKHRVVGVAALVYVGLAALEGGDALAAPGRDDPAALVRACLEPRHDAVVLATLAELLSLVAYAVSAIGLTGLVGPAKRSHR